MFKIPPTTIGAERLRTGNCYGDDDDSTKVQDTSTHDWDCEVEDRLLIRRLKRVTKSDADGE
jgi:hypothetical protein